MGGAGASQQLRRRPACGDYVGATAEASIVAGGGANLLVGGFQRSFTLQPLSVQAQTGVNLALTVTSMKLIHAQK